MSTASPPVHVAGPSPSVTNAAPPVSVAPSSMRSATPSAAVPTRRLEWSWSATVLVAVTFAGALVALQLWAIGVEYPLRVTSDVPTYLALLREMAAHPLSPQSPFLATPGVASPHATPYMLALALLWHALAPSGQAGSPLAVGRFLGFIGIPVSLATLALIAFYARRVAGSRVALATIPVLLALFGPAHVIWANDLSINGFLYAGFYPENVAFALALGALLALRGRGWPSLVLASLLSAAAMVESPLTGTLLAGLVAVDGCLRAVRGEPGVFRGSAALSIGFVIGMGWPTYQLNEAMALGGVPGSVIIAACVTAPRLAAMTAPVLRQIGTLIEQRALRLATSVASERTAIKLGVAGAAIVLTFAVWEVMLALRPPTDPLVHSNRLAIYWGEDRWRWFLMLAAGAPGVCGLVRIARRGQQLPLIWFAGCYGIALLGLVGLPVPVWWRFLLLCQVPLAIGTATVLVEARLRLTRRLVGGTLAFAVAFKLLTLLALPRSVTYFGAPLQSASSFGHIFRHSPAGLVASDPFTSFYIPGTTGHRVLTVTKAHVGSPTELADSTRGYALLHAFYAAPNTDWWPSAVALWNADVRFVLVEDETSLAPVNLQQFSTGPTPLIRTATERHMIGRMYWRLGRIGVLIHDGPEYALYRLSRTKLFPAAVPVRHRSTSTDRRIGNGHRHP
jgi:hypothetical protein